MGFILVRFELGLVVGKQEMRDSSGGLGLLNVVKATGGFAER